MTRRGTPAQRVVLLGSTEPEDVKLRDALAIHLSPRQRSGDLDVWHEGIIPAGEPLEQIEREIARADTIVVLLTPDFMADAARVRHVEASMRRGARIVAVIARACDWKHPPFSKLVPLPKGGRPVVLLEDPGLAWNEVATALVARGPAATEVLPPLLERLPPAEEGARELIRLVAAIFRDSDVSGGHDSQAHLAFSAIPPPIHLEAKGILGADTRVFFAVAWSPGQLDAGLRRPLEQLLTCLAPRSHTKPVSAPGSERWTLALIIPRDPTPDDEDWWSRHSVPDGWALEIWGPTRLLPFLQKTPALFARYYPERARALIAGYNGASFRELSSRYRERIALAHKHVRLLGFPPDVLRRRGVAADIRLSDLFVPPRLMGEEKSSSPVSLLDALKNPSVVVLGDPGTGKSTLLSFMVLLFAGGAAVAGIKLLPQAVPLFVSLRDFALELQQRSDLTLLDYLTLRARAEHVEMASPLFFESALRMGEAAVLLDGLDEVGNATLRDRVRSAVRALRAEYPHASFWITSRIHGYTPDIALPHDSFVHLRMAPFDDEQVDELLRRWYALWAPGDAAPRDERRASLRDAIQRTPSVRRLSSNPLLVTLMAFIHQISGQLPQERCELYERCMDMLLRTWQPARRDRAGLTDQRGTATLTRPSTQKEYLARLALFVQERNQGEEGDEARGLVPRRDALDRLAEWHLGRAEQDRPGITPAEALAEMEDFLDHLCDGTGLLVDRGGGLLSFLHLSFQEYLAAWAFLCDRRPHQVDQGTFFTRHAGDPAWEEVLLLRLYIVLHEPGGGGRSAFDSIFITLFQSLDQSSSGQAWLLLCRALRDGLDVSPTSRREILRRACSLFCESGYPDEKWYAALDEIRVFADSIHADLRAVLAEAQRTGPPAEALACLHLEARLFGLPDDVAHRLEVRPDVEVLLSDLTLLSYNSSIAELLARLGEPRHWEVAFDALPTPALYRLTLGWATGALSSPGGAEAPLLAAARWMRRKIGAEARSRTTFAANHRERDVQELFRGAVTLRLAGRYDEVEAPLSAWAVSDGNIDMPSAPQGTLLAANFAADWSKAIPPERDPVKDALVRWACSVAERALAEFTDGAPLAQRLHRMLGVFADGWLQPSTEFGRTFFITSLGFPSLFWGKAAVERPLEGVITQLLHDFRWETVTQQMEAFQQFPIPPPTATFREFSEDVAPIFVSAFGWDFLRGLGADSGSFDMGGMRLPLMLDGRPLTPHELTDPLRIMLVLKEPGIWATASTRERSELNRGIEARSVRLELRSPLALPMLLGATMTAAATNHKLSLLRHMMGLFPDGAAPLMDCHQWLYQHPMEAHAVALSWEEHARCLRSSHGRIDCAAGALALAHADYAALMSGHRFDGPIWSTLRPTSSVD